jgi:hypothetical protein
MDAFYDAYADYVRNVIPLKVRHLWDVTQRTSDPVPLSVALQSHVDIFRKTMPFTGENYWDFWQGKVPEWEAIKRQIRLLFEQHEGDSNTDALEQACVAYLWPFIEPCMETLSRPIQEQEDRPYGCWAYLPNKDEPQQMDLHFANAYVPDSPFHRMDELTRDLRRVIEDTQAQHGELQTVGMCSWLNGFAPFQVLFPPTWVDSMRDTWTHFGTYGIWGQYVNRRGAFHHGHGAMYRRTGEHPFLMTTCSCTIEEALRYLRQDGWKERL